MFIHTYQIANTSRVSCIDRWIDGSKCIIIWNYNEQQEITILIEHEFQQKITDIPFETSAIYSLITKPMLTGIDVSWPVFKGITKPYPFAASLVST